MVTYGSKGYTPQAADNGNYVSVLTVPEGYHCKVNYFLGGAKGSVTINARWSDGNDYTFLHGKNMSAGDLVEFGGDGKYLIMTEGETIDIKCSSVDAVFIISYELYIAPASTIVL
jgi:phage gp45-like